MYFQIIKKNIYIKIVRNHIKITNMDQFVNYLVTKLLTKMFISLCKHINIPENLIDKYKSNVISGMRIISGGNNIETCAGTVSIVKY